MVAVLIFVRPPCDLTCAITVSLLFDCCTSIFLSFFLVLCAAYCCRSLIDAIDAIGPSNPAVCGRNWTGEPTRTADRQTAADQPADQPADRTARPHTPTHTHTTSTTLNDTRTSSSSSKHESTGAAPTTHTHGSRSVGVVAGRSGRVDFPFVLSVRQSAADQCGRGKCGARMHAVGTAQTAKQHGRRGGAGGRRGQKKHSRAASTAAGRISSSTGCTALHCTH